MQGATSEVPWWSGFTRDHLSTARTEKQEEKTPQVQAHPESPGQHKKKDVTTFTTKLN